MDDELFYAPCVNYIDLWTVSKQMDDWTIMNNVRGEFIKRNEFKWSVWDSRGLERIKMNYWKVTGGKLEIDG